MKKIIILIGLLFIVHNVFTHAQTMPPTITPDLARVVRTIAFDIAKYEAATKGAKQQARNAILKVVLSEKISEGAVSKYLKSYTTKKARDSAIRKALVPNKSKLLSWNLTLFAAVVGLGPDFLKWFQTNELLKLANEIDLPVPNYISINSPYLNECTHQKIDINSQMPLQWIANFYFNWALGRGVPVEIVLEDDRYTVTGFIVNKFYFEIGQTIASYTSIYQKVLDRELKHITLLDLFYLGLNLGPYEEEFLVEYPEGITRKQRYLQLKAVQQENEYAQSSDKLPRGYGTIYPIVGGGGVPREVILSMRATASMIMEDIRYRRECPGGADPNVKIKVPGEMIHGRIEEPNVNNVPIAEPGTLESIVPQIDPVDIEDAFILMNEVDVLIEYLKEIAPSKKELTEEEIEVLKREWEQLHEEDPDYNRIADQSYIIGKALPRFILEKLVIKAGDLDRIIYVIELLMSADFEEITFYLDNTKMPYEDSAIWGEQEHEGVGSMTIEMDGETHVLLERTENPWERLKEGLHEWIHLLGNEDDLAWALEGAINGIVGH